MLEAPEKVKNELKNSTKQVRENPYQKGSKAAKQFDANPYTEDKFTREHTTWDSILEGLGFRSSYQAALEDWRARGQEWDSQVATTEAEDKYNTDEAKAARMREAGLNPDLLGTEGASEAAEFTEPESPDVNAPGDSENKIFAAIGNVGKIMAWATSMTGDIFKNLGLWEEIKSKRTENRKKLIDLANDFITGNWSDEIKSVDPNMSEFDDQKEQLQMKALDWARNHGMNKEDAAEFANNVADLFKGRKKDWYEWKEGMLNARDKYYFKRGNKYTMRGDTEKEATKIMGNLVTNYEEVLTHDSWRNRYKAENDNEKEANRDPILEAEAEKGEHRTKKDKADLVHKARTATETAISKLEQGAEDGDILSIMLVSALADVQLKVLE